MKLGTCYYPEHWPESMWDDDAYTMAKFGITQVRIGEFSWSRIEPSRNKFQWAWLDKAITTLSNHNLKIIMCTPTATPPKWLIDEIPEILALNEANQTRKFGSRRHYCFSSKNYRKESRRITNILLNRYGKNPNIISWQTDNEYGCHNTVVSFSPMAEKAFQKWLQVKYINIENLNKSWGNVFWSQEYNTFEQILLPNNTVTEANPAHSLDFKRFSSDQVISFNNEQVNIIRAHSDALITHNCMGHFTSFDHYALGESLDIMTWDSYPLGFLDQGWSTEKEKLQWMRSGHPDFAAFHHDLYRNCSKGRWGVMEQQPGAVNWAPNNPTPANGMVKLWTLEAAAHGAEYCSYFRWRQVPFGQEQNHAGLFDSRNEISQGALEVAEVSSILGKLKSLETASNEVALMFDYPSKWMLDIQPQGNEWNYEKLCFEFYTTLRRLGLSIDIISPDHDISKYKLVVAPSLPVIPINLLQNAKIANTKLLFGPRSGSKTSEYQIPPEYPFNRDFQFIKSESLRDSASLKINMNDKIYYSKNWRDIIECKGINNIKFSDGHPAYIHHVDYDYLATWPTYELLKDLLLNLTDKIGIKTACLDENIRIRHTNDLTFAFNYGDEIVDISKMTPENKFIYGGSKIDPHGISIWKTQKNK